MSNHYHAVVHDADGSLPAFLEHFHKLVAKALNVRWSRWENLWSTEQTCAVHLVNPEDVFEKVVYVLANPVVDHLVDRVTDWPGASSLLYLGGSRELVIERPLEFFRANGKMAEQLTLRTVAPDGVDPQRWAVRVREAVATREQTAREERHQRRTPFLGRKAVLRASAFDRPTTPEPRRNLRPAVACRDRQSRIGALLALKRFREAYATARTRLLAGADGVLFPAGTYRWPRLRLARAVVETAAAA